MSKKLITQVFGVVLVLVGLLGFVNDPVLGLFDVNLLHNIIHLATGGAALFLASQGESGAVTFGKIFTVVYALVTVLGFMLPGGEGLILGLVPVNMADNFLHLFLTAVFAYIGFVPTRSAAKA